MECMEIERAKIENLETIMSVYDKAKGIMRASGNMHQWTGGYPARALIAENIESGKLYTVKGDDGLIHGVFYLAKEDDPTYQKITGGNWLSDEPYCVIHRIAQDGCLRGLLKAALDFSLSLCTHTRIDTHEDNVIMRHQLEKNGLSERGIIYLEDGSERIAYERVLIPSAT